MMVITENKEIKSRKRNHPVKWVSFGDARDGVSGYAEGWFFWVHEAFKPALDIKFSEIIDKKETDIKRKNASMRLFGVSHHELKKRILASKEQLAKSKEWQEIIKYKHTILKETEGEPLLFSFRQFDGLESRCGNWYIQVTQASSDNADGCGTIKIGSVGFNLFLRNHEQGKNGIWQPKAWFSTTQKDFVNLLRLGKCEAVDLSNSMLRKIKMG